MRKDYKIACSYVRQWIASGFQDDILHDMKTRLTIRMIDAAFRTYGLDGLQFVVTR